MSGFSACGGTNSLVFQEKTNSLPTNKKKQFLALSEERKKYQLEIIKSSNKSDPIDSWHRYLKWTKLHFADTKSIEYKKLLEEFLAKFFQTSQYKNDPRYVNAWLDMAQSSNHAEERFAYMRNNGIGVGCASFYVAWADEYEKKGNIEFAKKLYDLGIQAHAQPFETIRQMKIKFEERTSINKARTSLTSSFSLEQSDNFNRNFESKENQQDFSKNDVNKQSFDVFKDKDISRQEQYGVEQDENVQDISMECMDTDAAEDEKILHPLDEILTVDESYPFQESVGHRKIRNLYGESLTNVFPMYPMKKVYSHLGEFQLEEVMAAKWRKKMSSSTSRISSRHQSNHCDVNLLKQDVELFKQDSERAKLKLMRKKNQLSTVLDALHSNLGIDVPLQDDDVTVNIQNVCLQLRQLDVAEKEREDIFQKAKKASGSFTENPRLWGVNDSIKLPPQTSSFRASNLNQSASRKESSFDSREVSKLAQPSPTLCTKEAMGNILDMFQQPLDGDIEKDPFTRGSINPSNLSIFLDEPDEDKAEPFRLFSDDVNEDGGGAPAKETTGFEIFCDEESSKLMDEDQVFFEHTPKPKKFEIFSDLSMSRKQPASSFQIFHDQSGNKSTSSSHFNAGLCERKTPGKMKRSCELMSETIVASQDDLIEDKQLTDKSNSENISFCEHALAESTSYKQIYLKNDKLESHESNEKQAKELSPILEEVSADMQSSNQLVGESLFSQRHGVSNTTGCTLPSLPIIDSGLKQASSINFHDTIDVELCSRSTALHLPSRSRTNVFNDISVFPSSHLAPLNIVEDPWDESARREWARKTLENHSDKVMWLKEKSPTIRKNSNLLFENFSVVDTIGEGGFAKVYLVVDDKEKTVAVKVQSPPCEWEITIMETTKRRLRKCDHPLINSVLIDIQNALVFRDASWIITEYIPHGTLLDFVNNTSKSTKISVLQFHQICLQVLQLVDALHSVHIIHADIKPDNFLVCSDYRSFTLLKDAPKLKLIDFGRSIDMALFPPNTAFKKSCGTSAFVCTEMKLNLPWNYHTDFYGIAGTIFLVISSSYMKVAQDNSGRWKPSDKLPRWTDNMWKEMFSSLLNQPTPSNKFDCSYHNSPLPRLILNFKEAISRL